MTGVSSCIREAPLQRGPERHGVPGETTRCMRYWAVPPQLSRGLVITAVAVVLLAGGLAIILVGRHDAAPPAPVVDLLDERQLSPQALNKELRRALASPGCGQIDIPLGELTQDTLWTAFGVRRRGKSREPVAATFEIILRDSSGAEHRIARETIDLPRGVRTSTWLERRVNVSSYQGQAKRIRLRTICDTPEIETLWARPLLYAGGDRGARPVVILISIDTLGAKHTSVYGYERQTTPGLERFAADAVVFEQAVTAQSWTLTAHVSLLTSLYPDTHRVSFERALAQEHPLLPELLGREGYVTLGLVNNPYLNPAVGYGRAFDLYNFDHEHADERQRRIKRSVEESHQILERWIDGGLPRPFFLLYHLIDAHADWRDMPYEAPAPFADRFVPPELRDVRLSHSQGARASITRQIINGTVNLSARECAWAEALYDGGVAYTDHHLGRFFDLLRSYDLYDDALIVVTSDHGEEFLEHGRMFHTQGYEECVKVPLLIKFPRNKFAGRRVPNQVHLIDVMPTILDVIGLSSPEHAEGHSLLPVIEGQSHPESIVFAKGENYSMTPDDVYVARSERWKLIWRMASDRTELYDLKNDPGEQNDLASARPDQVTAMLERIEAHRLARNQGFKVRVPAHREEGSLIVRLSSDAPFIRVTPRADVVPSAVLPKPRLSEDGRQLTLDLLPSDQWDHAIGVDFDLDVSATRLHIEARLAGQPLAPGRLLLGEEHTPAGAQPASFAPRDATLRVTGGRPVDVQATTPVAQIHLWEVRLPRGAELDLSESELEALRALGYVH